MGRLLLVAVAAGLLDLVVYLVDLRLHLVADCGVKSMVRAEPTISPPSNEARMIPVFFMAVKF